MSHVIVLVAVCHIVVRDVGGIFGASFVFS